MKANKAYKYRLYPTREQRSLISRTFGCCRFVWNLGLEMRQAFYEFDGTSVSYEDTAQLLSMMKQEPEFAFLKEVDSIALQQSLRHLDQAYKNFFKNPKHFRYPKFKSRRKSVQSYSTNCVNGNIKVGNGFVRLPKVGEVKAKTHRKIPDGYVLKSATVSKNAAGEYYVSLLFAYESQVQEETPRSFLGLDYSMAELYVDSDGNRAQYPKFYRKTEEKLGREQRRLSHMKKGSKNWEKQRVRVAKLHRKVACQRQDFLHKLSRKLAEKYDCVCIEDLDMAAMAKSLNFGKSVHDNSWGMFTSFLEYKLQDRGGRLQRVDKWFPSSQLCSRCGHKHKKVKDLSVRGWTCPQCGEEHDRDVNAAVNIREEGKRLATTQ